MQEEKKVVRYETLVTEGLSKKQVEERINDQLVNKTKLVVGKSYFEIILTNVFSFFNILLYAIAALMIVAKKYDGLFFLGVLIPNVIIGLYEDIKVRRLMDKVHIVNSPRSVVVRDSVESVIFSKDLALDDIVKLKQNDQISADSIVVEGVIGVNESLLTGESLTIYKEPGDTVYSGTYVVSGKAFVRVNKVGKDSYVESLNAAANKYKRSKSEILLSLKRMFRVIGAIVIVCGAAMIGLYAFQGKFSSFESFQNIIGPISGSLVSMIPAGLYLLTSVSLAVSVIALAKKHAQVQEFYSVEMLARTNVLCVDKTGTITDGTLNVSNVVPLNNTSLDEIKRVVGLIISNTMDENATAKALRTIVNNVSFTQASVILPFNTENKYSAVHDGKQTYVLGAPEFINLVDKGGVIKRCEEYTKQGYRVIVVAQSDAFIENNKFDGLSKAIGIIVLQDHIKDDAIETFKWFKDNNVSIRVISGDSAVTVSEIAKRVGIDNADKYVSLEGKTLEVTRELALKYTVFGRVSPEQKQIIVETLQANKNTVAMTGDGVNDILALKKADCSIAMANGAEAAKNVSHIVLTNSNFSSLPQVVAEGRRVINNLQRTCSLFLVKTIFATFFTILFFCLSIANSNFTYPFLTNHMYIWELVFIGLSSFFLALQPNSELIEGRFLTNIFKKAVPAAITIILSVIVVFTMYLLQSNNVMYTGINTSQSAISMAVLAFTVIAGAVLFKVCLPLDKYRGIVFGSAISLMVILLSVSAVLAYNGSSLGAFFKIDFKSLTPLNYVQVLVIAVIFISLYLFLTFLVNYLLKKKGETSNDTNK